MTAGKSGPSFHVLRTSCHFYAFVHRFLLHVGAGRCRLSLKAGIPVEICAPSRQDNMETAIWVRACHQSTTCDRRHRSVGSTLFNHSYITLCVCILEQGPVQERIQKKHLLDGPPWGVLPSVNLGAHPRSDGPHFFLKFPTPEREGCQHWPQKMPHLKCRRHRGGEQHGQHCEELKKAKQERVRHGSRQAPVPPAPAEQFAAQAGSTGIASQASFLIGMTRARGRGAVATPGPRFQC